ncbi:MAG: DUF222 domain-containing protein [Actinomycetota bacterium]|nr:DUF222 domain-containing protein [Actinomycetota bacterium]MDA3002218.1 DUF222 domain-containing protein [Actinomycetota bacterium]
MSSLTADEVRCRLAEIRVERSRLDAEEASLVGRLSELSCERSSSVVPEFEMTQYAGLRSREASRVVQRSAMLESLPEFGSALASGSIVAGHVDVVADSLKKVSDEDRGRVLAQADGLLRSARRLSVDQFAKHMRSEVARLSADRGLGVFERQRRATFLKFWNDVDGMVHLRGAFDPERGSVLLSRLEQRVEAMFHSGDVEVPVEVGPGVEPNDHRRALALAASVNGTSGSNGDTVASPVRAEIVVHLPLEQLTGSAREAGVITTQHGVELPVATVRRLACDGDIIPVVLNGDSVPLDVGRAKRLATVHQRRALGAVYESCAIPECQVKFAHCEPHHIEYWENGGRTDLANLVPLCSRHHHAAHEGGWTLRLDPNTRQLTVKTSRDGP